MYVLDHWLSSIQNETILKNDILFFNQYMTKNLYHSRIKLSFHIKKTQLNRFKNQKKLFKDMLLVSFTIRYGSIEIKMIFFSQFEFSKINCQFVSIWSAKLGFVYNSALLRSKCKQTADNCTQNCVGGINITEIISENQRKFCRLVDFGLYCFSSCHFVS